MTRFFSSIVLALIIISCSTTPDNTSIITSGKYTLTMQLGEDSIILNTSLSDDYLIVHNGKEQILVPIRLKGDTFYADFPVFDSGLELTKNSDGYSGKWIKYYKEDYKIPVSLKPNWTLGEIENADTLKYNISFSPNSPDQYPAIGLFQIKDNTILGSFATETGDYRYLHGTVEENKFKLSTLDGSHAFLFTGEFKNDSIVNGKFYSGNHWKEPFAGVLDPNVVLTNPDSISKVNNTVEFAFLNTDSSTFKFNSNTYKDTAVIIQVLGSWCPNCLDETKFLSEVAKNYSKQPLKIIGIAFESKNEFAYYKKQISRLKKDANISYPILFGGKASKALASDTLNFIDEIKSFPTTIVLDKDHKVKKIHTGFYGPGTGSYYVKFKEEFYLLLDKIFEAN